ncbi:flagellar protein FlgN [Stutzerimonas balearica]|uniref:flagellar protein FlgN n=1 Tax=Stutzerimonas balearica TaxID=74829 RepID=UPI000774D369|nr:flagellar protein FlgN [Stutzerimonas balearica]OMG64822.1 flagellar protein FlgN [Stutzerimonas balearica]
MNQRDRLLAVVADDIRQDCEQYLALRDLMQTLYTFLLERDSAEIDRLNLQITRHVEALEVRARRRAKVLGAFRMSGDGDGMQRLLASYPADQRAELQTGWQQLGSLARHCQQLNERNGKLLAMHHDLLQQLLGDQRDARVYQPHAY